MGGTGESASASSPHPARARRSGASSELGRGLCASIDHSGWRWRRQALTRKRNGTSTWNRDAYANQIGDVGGDLPFKVARFLTYNQGLLHDLARLEQNRDRADVQTRMIRLMGPLWQVTRALGEDLTTELRQAAGVRPSM